MAKTRWTRIDRIMRWLHLYTSFFLVPWMIIYAASAFCLNHRPWFVEHLAIEPPKWELVERRDFVPPDSFPKAPEEQARAILQHMDLDGPHFIQGKPTRAEFRIIRVSGSGNYRVVWSRGHSTVTVHRQRPFSAFRLMHFLHFRGGYAQPYASLIIWAIVVDLVAVSIVLWIVSGLYIWVRRPKGRLAGGICLASGFVLFAVLTAFLCQ